MAQELIHRMLPGTQERLTGPECICGADWNYWDSRCTSLPQLTEEELNPNGEWRFNKNYKDLAQVEAFLPDFMKRLEELTAAGKYRYNDAFKGHIPGIAGEHEDTGIYLLQGLERRKAQEVKIANLLENGYRHLTRLKKVTKFSHVVLFPRGQMNGEWREFTDSRVVPYENGELSAILEKGKRTNGMHINGRGVLVKD